MRIKDILNINKKYKGAILVEFALAVPILATILYYASDVPQYSRYKTQMKNAAYIAASMIQNVTQNREDKRITKVDLKSIFWTCFYNMFNGLQIASPYPLGYYPYTYIYYIKGLPGNKANVIWRADNLYSDNGPKCHSPSISTGNIVNSTVRYQNTTNGVDPSTIHKDLKIKDGEIKIIVESTLFLSTASKNFGFYLLKPKSPTNNGYYFHTVVIFSPKAGVFTESISMP